MKSIRPSPVLKKELLDFNFHGQNICFGSTKTTRKKYENLGEGVQATEHNSQLTSCNFA